MKIVDKLLNLRSTIKKLNRNEQQKKSAGFNSIASLTAQELNGIHDNPYGEEGCIKNHMRYQNNVDLQEERW